MSSRSALLLLTLAACTPTRDRSECTPDCENRECGEDSVCGDSCGTCAAPASCDSATGHCDGACVPACDGRACGPDPTCGSSCGSCATGTCRADGTCQAAACTPACGPRTCGTDPVCGTSCGTCSGDQTCSADGRCVSVPPGNKAPVVVKVTLTPATLTPDVEAAVEVTVSDADGLNDLVIVGLTNVRGTTLASLSPTLTPGVYSGAISWDQLQRDEAITFTAPTTRTLVARAIDGASHVTDKPFAVPLACDPRTLGACDGTCTDLATDVYNCGACDRYAGEDHVCRSGRPACPTGFHDCAGLCLEEYWSVDHCGSCTTRCPIQPVPAGADGSTPLCRQWEGSTWSCGASFGYETRVVCATKCQQAGLRCESTNAVYGENYTYTNDDGCAQAPRATVGGVPFWRIACFCY